MAKYSVSLRNEIISKKKTLDEALIQLKKEFVGIDNVIDEVIKGVSYWYMFPESQNAPIIINLWGMTGIGKTSLITRLSEIIGYEKKFYRFNMGETSGEGVNTIRTKLRDLHENINGFPCIIALDEFQLARTIDENENEVKEDKTKVIWDLLDNGKFSVLNYPHELSGFYETISNLSYMLLKGVKVIKGLVTENKSEHIINMGMADEHINYRHGRISKVQEMRNVLTNNIDNIPVPFVPEWEHATIFSLARGIFETHHHVKEKLMQLNGNQTIEFLWEIFSIAISPKVIDCSKSLIFVIGNLDEAYKMSNNFNPDMSADEFHERSLMVNITDIKKALKHRFRNEQIARLGNFHIIYPAFNEIAFQTIIQIELKRIEKKVFEDHKIRIWFDQSLEELIYKEGVFPTQGTRPVFTTINQIVRTKIGRIVSEMVLNNLNPVRILVKAKKDVIKVTYFRNNKIIHEFFEKQTLNLETIRKNRKDEMQAITAVHESGHAVLSICLMKIVPELVFSITADSDCEGFMYSKFKNKYTSRIQIIRKLAIFLGGYVAEKMIFGEDYLTTGSEYDLEKASAFITYMLKENGMGKSLGYFHVKDLATNNFLHDETNEINEEAKIYINKAAKIAEETLCLQKALLLKMSDYLADHRCMNKEQIKAMVKKYFIINDEDITAILDNEPDLYYRNNLKQQVSTLSIHKIDLKQLANIEQVSLNKGQKEYYKK